MITRRSFFRGAAAGLFIAAAPAIVRATSLDVLPRRPVGITLGELAERALRQYQQQMIDNIINESQFGTSMGAGKSGLVAMMRDWKFDRTPMVVSGPVFRRA